MNMRLTVADNVGGIIVGILNPYMLNSTEVSLYLRPIARWGQLLIGAVGSRTQVCLPLVRCRYSWSHLDILPSSRAQVSLTAAPLVVRPQADPFGRGRSYGELDILFEKRIPARKFKTTHVDEFEVEQRQVAEGGGGAMIH